MANDDNDEIAMAQSLLAMEMENDNGVKIAMARSVREINMENIEQEGEDSVIKYAEERTGLKASDVKRDARCFAGALLMAAADEAHTANEPSKEEKDLFRSALCDDAFGSLVPGKKQTPAEEEARNPNKMMGDELVYSAARLLKTNFQVRSLFYMCVIGLN